MKMKLILGVLLSLLAVQVFAQGERPEVRKQVENFFAKFDAYIGAKDTKGLFTLFAPGYYSVDKQGKRTELAEWKKGVLGANKTTKDIKSHIQIKNVQLQDQEIVVWIQQKITYTSKQNGKWVTATSTSRWAETLKATDAGLKSVSSQELFTNEPWTFKTNGQ